MELYRLPVSRAARTARPMPDAQPRAGARAAPGAWPRCRHWAAASRQGDQIDVGRARLGLTQQLRQLGDIGGDAPGSSRVSSLPAALRPSLRNGRTRAPARAPTRAAPGGLRNSAPAPAAPPISTIPTLNSARRSNGRIVQSASTRHFCTRGALWASAVAAKLAQPRGRVRWRVFCS